MCGIVGILNKDINEPVNRQLLTSMTEVISHRGPDDWGIYINGNVGLGHRRLSIIDIDAGHQPMIDEQRGRAIVYNGEVYNYLEIKENLKKRGYVFHTNCDTEVLLKLINNSEYHELEKLNGMFAFALWDEQQKSLLLGRDRLGIKPLYFVNSDKHILFSSEIKSLLQHPKVSREVNNKKIYEFIAYRGIAGTETIYKNIYQVPPGHVIKLQAPKYELTVQKFWQEGKNKFIDDYASQSNNYINQFIEIFSDSVKARLISDVPVGTFNSGGIDSSLVSAIVRESKIGELHTFSAGFDEKSHDERAYAQIVSDKLGTIHHTIVMNEYEYCNALEETLWHLEEPINHAHSVQILHLSRLAKNYVTVVLTGEGADELFAGYPRYNLPKLAYSMPASSRMILSRLLTPMAESLRLRRTVKLLEAFSLSDEKLIIDNARYVPLSTFRRIVKHNLDYSTRKNIYNESCKKFSDRLQSHLYYDQRTYLSSLLTRLDKMSMGASIEARVPFLDYRLIEWSYKIPSNIKLRFLNNKWLVKKAGINWLPKNIINRKKVGFAAPIGKWLRNPDGLGRYLEILRDQKARERGYFDQSIVEQLLNEHLSKSHDHSEILWGLLNLELWHRNFIDDVRVF